MRGRATRRHAPQRPSEGTIMRLLNYTTAGQVKRQAIWGLPRRTSSKAARHAARHQPAPASQSRALPFLSPNFPPKRILIHSGANVRNRQPRQDRPATETTCTHISYKVYNSLYDYFQRLYILGLAVGSRAVFSVQDAEDL